MVRNFTIVNGTPFFPGRSCRNSTGDPSLARTSRAVTSMIGAKTISAATARPISRRRFKQARYIGSDSEVRGRGCGRSESPARQRLERRQIPLGERRTAGVRHYPGAAVAAERMRFVGAVRKSRDRIRNGAAVLGLDEDPGVRLVAHEAARNAVD